MRDRALTALYAVTIFVSAFLIFWVEPMFSKAVLPLLGGSPGVWNTALVFFQGTLLAGYLYAHGLPSRLDVRWQAGLHLLLVAVAFVVLPVSIPEGWDPPAHEVPTYWLLGLFAVALGLPFFVLSATAPLLQRWFSMLGHEDSEDPYHLYAASNLGSLGALLAFPLLLEPALHLATQSRLWTGVYGVAAVLLAGCAGTLWLSRRRAPAGPPERSPNGENGPPDGESGSGAARPGWLRKARWALLAFVPSSLLLAVTSYLTTDVAAVPLLWVVPLALYLLTFVLAFSRREWVPHEWVKRAVPAVILLLVLDLLSTSPQQYELELVLPFHLVAFFVLALACHGELARDRPPPSQLTRFYVWLSAGGVAGGAFNALLAPVVFDTLVEYPLVLVLACAVLPSRTLDPGGPKLVWSDVALPALLAATGVLPVLGIGSQVRYQSGEFLLFYGCAAIWVFTFRKRAVRLALGVAALLIACTSLIRTPEVLHTERSFFGTLTVTRPQEGVHVLMHGTTIHGSQRVTPGHRTIPQSYYAPPGPVGQLFRSLRDRKEDLRVGVVGLGTGSLACYREPGDRWTFFEIDPAVVRVARDTSYFHYLSECAPNVRIVMGDGRRSIRREPPASYDLLVLDAFSSDAVPVHLLTREAVETYLSRLDEDGLLVANIANRYVNLRPVMSALGQELDLAVRHQLFMIPDSVPEARRELWELSRWAVLGRGSSALGSLSTDPRWRGPVEERMLWTDSHSNIVGLLRW